MHEMSTLQTCCSIYLSVSRHADCGIPVLQKTKIQIISPQQCLLLQVPSHQDSWDQIHTAFCSTPSLQLVL